MHYVIHVLCKHFKSVFVCTCPKEEIIVYFKKGLRLLPFLEIIREKEKDKIKHNFESKDKIVKSVKYLAILGYR